jgi:sigma-54 dependent transcriptional regulator, acetoin dehydrogenase operon transcriptional activator AcoR
MGLEADDLDLTRTEAGELESEQAQQCLGILWLTPEERFHPLTAGEVLGRGDSCSLRLDGPSVSRQHARVEREGPLWLLRDLESKNGSFINTVRREIGAIGAGDTLRLGDWVGVVCWMPQAAVVAQQWFRELVPGMLLSAPTLARFEALPALAASDVPLILLGETGTGKERLARAIHDLSGRSGTLQAINCSAIPEGLAEAELFGHRKGAFTGASEASAGRIVAAREGTLLLDEILDLPAAIQSKLLRALEERAVTPVGSSQLVRVDFRVLSASQVRLDRLVQKGEFRADLYARLNGAELELPPLRQRRQEVLRLLGEAMRPLLGAMPQFDSMCAERLCAYAWPYNVRELIQLARMLSVARKERFGLGDLPQRIREGAEAPAPAPAGPQQTSERSSRRQLWLSRHAAEFGKLEHALRQCSGNVTEAARIAGIPRHRARRLLEAAAAHAPERWS